MEMPSRMEESRKARWTFRLSILGSVLAVASVLWSTYQWMDSRRESRISAAVDISRNYLKETSDSTSNEINRAALGLEMSNEDALIALRGANVLEYIAFLANNNRINEDYLAEELKCSIKHASEGAKNIKRKMEWLNSVSYPQLEKFATRISCAISISLQPSQ
jgi:hypothetical protein